MMKHLRKTLLRAAAAVVVGCCAAATSFGLLAGKASAAVVSKDLFVVGDGLLTLDTDTNLEWLDLTETAGQSYNQVDQGFGGYTTTLGFRYANVSQVLELQTNAGIVDQTGTQVAGNFEPGKKLIDLLGCLVFCSDDSPFANHPGHEGIADRDSFSGTFATSIFVQLNLEASTAVADAIDNPNWMAKGTSVGVLGSYLIREAVIPLPAALPLFGTGLGLLGFLGWRRRRQAQAV